MREKNRRKIQPELLFWKTKSRNKQNTDMLRNTPHRSRRGEKEIYGKGKKDRTWYAWDMEIKNGLGGLYSGAD
jgi:hypothetical protein